VNTLKTAVVVVLLLAVLYGVYMLLNKTDASAPPELAWQQEPIGPLQIDPGTPFDPNRSASPRSTSPPGSPPAHLHSPVIDSDSALTPYTPFPTSPTASGPSTTPPSTTSPSTTPPAETEDYAAPSDDYPYAGSMMSSASPDPRSNTPYVTPRQHPADLQITPPRKPEANTSPKQIGASSFERAWRSAQGQIEQQQLRLALRTLSIYYDSPDLTATENQRLLDVLDPLAGHVIYSADHLVEPAYEVRRDETLYEIAERYQVPWQLLKNINGIKDPAILVPGTKLKVLRGPFRAEVRLLEGSQGELTLFLNELYAGRFPVSVGNDPPPLPGKYLVRDKQEGRDYYPRNRAMIPARHPSNPYGQWWLDLGSEIAIHSSPTSASGGESLGCISLSPIDAADVFGILSRGSSVVIRR
jgi:hypothetical protein